MPVPTVRVPAKSKLHALSESYSMLAPIGTAKVPVMPGAASTRVSFLTQGEEGDDGGARAWLHVPMHHKPPLVFLSVERRVPSMLEVVHIVQRDLLVEAVRDTSKLKVAAWSVGLGMLIEVEVDATQPGRVVVGFPLATLACRATFAHAELVRVAELLDDDDDEEEEEEPSPRSRQVLELYDRYKSTRKVEPHIQVSRATIGRIVKRHRS